MSRLFVGASAILLVALWVATRAPAAPVPEGAKKPVLFYAVQKGARWVYDDGDGKVLTVVVAKVEDRDGAKLVTVEELDGDPHQTVSVSAAGVVLVSYRGRTLEPPVVLLKSPPKAGDSWDGKFGDWPCTHTTREPEKVTTPAGTFETVRVGRRLTGVANVQGYTTSWYAPGVGLVKAVAGERTRVLKSFTPDK